MRDRKKKPEIRVVESKAYDDRIKTLAKHTDLDKPSATLKYILGKYKNTNSQISYILAIAYYYGKNNKPKAQELMLDKAYKLRLVSNNDDQAILPNRVFISRDELKSYIKQLEPKTDFKSHLKYLALVLYTYLPPLRSEWKSVKIINHRSEDTKKSDVLGITKKNMILYLRLPIKQHSSIVFNLPIHIQRIIRKSLTDFPRDYVLGKGEEPMTYPQLRLLLKSIDPRITIDSLRASYTTDFFSKPRSIKEKKELATNMRSSINILESTYLKFKNITEQKEFKAPDEKELKEMKQDLQGEVPDIVEEKEEKKQERRAPNTPYQNYKKHCIKNPDICKIRTLLSRFNRAGRDDRKSQRNPNDISIVKYSLYQDDNEKWKSKVLEELIETRDA